MQIFDIQLKKGRTWPFEGILELIADNYINLACQSGTLTYFAKGLNWEDSCSGFKKRSRQTAIVAIVLYKVMLPGVQMLCDKSLVTTNVLEKTGSSPL